jgi:hypothetical protein
MIKVTDEMKQIGVRAYWRLSPDFTSDEDIVEKIYRLMELMRRRQERGS